MKVPTELYNIETFFSFQGMSTFVYVVISGWTPQGMKKWKKWIALALAEVVSLSGTMFLPVPDALGYFIAVANGVMIATAALGMSSIATATYENRRKKRITPTSAAPRLADRFFEPWV
jgi:hypothetical protein